VSPNTVRVLPSAREAGRIPELDGIRALAILAVLVVHSFANSITQPFAPSLHGLGKVAYTIASHGWLGVDLFFVLSGFLITGILLDSRRRPTYFRDFWIRRALRILPLVIAVVAILTVFYHPTALYVVMALFFAVDFAPLFHLGNNGMGPLWSLAVEEQFYLFWPFLVFFLQRRALAVVTLVVIAVEPVVRLLTMGGLLDVLWCRIDGLAIGALIAIYIRSPYFSRGTTFAAVGVALATAAALVAVDLRVASASYALRITEADLLFGSAIAIALVERNARWLAPLRSAPARFIANTSFCAYLIHVPLLDLARVIGIGGGIADPFAAAAARAAFAVPATFVIAALSRQYFELPFLRLKDTFAPAPARPSPAAEPAAHASVPVAETV
jgi:peptidoglycan/LPS O-acetylase OafA/YrhL